MLAHRDGWFEGASDNASGVATMVGLAEYFAKVPRAQRRRTMVFLGSAGHHDSTETTGHATARSNVSGTWLVDNRVGLFAKTALFHQRVAHLDPLYLRATRSEPRAANQYLHGDAVACRRGRSAETPGRRRPGFSQLRCVDVRRT